jgi:glycosyltransferase 2 family protein
MLLNKKSVFTFLKIALTFVLLYVVFANIPLHQVWGIVQHSNPWLLIIALLCFIASQLVSANRLLHLFIWSGYALSPKTNTILYLVGMFYNFFIPGGIGGDAYKVYILNKDYHWPIKKLTSIIFIDRLMGLIAIGILMLLFCFFVPYFSENNLFWLLLLLLSLEMVFSYFFIKWVFPSFLAITTPSVLKSILIQLLQCICIVSLLSSISETGDYFKYVIAFLLSSVLSIFSFSGIGIREMILYQAATLFDFDAMKAVTIGLLFSMLTAFVSLFGIYFHFRKSGSN